MKNTGLLGIAFLFLCTQVYAQNEGSKLTLRSCIDIALANNIPVKQTELQKQVDKVNLDQSRYNRLPNVAAGLGYGINSGRSIDPFTNAYNNQQLSSSNASLSASVPVFRGFQIKNAVKQAEFTYAASRMDLQQEKDNLTLNVILAFLQLMNDEDVLLLATEQKEVTKKQVDRLEVLNQEGAISPSVLFDMKGQYASDQLALVNASQSLEKSRLSLTQFMNVPYSKELQFNRNGLDLTIVKYTAAAGDIYNTAVQKLAMVKAADLRTKAAAKAKKVATAGFYPTLSLFGQLGTNYSSAAKILTASGTTDVASSDYVTVNGNNLPVMTKQTNYNSQKISFTKQYDNNLSTYLGLNLSIPIFSSFRNRSNVKLARLEEKRTGYVAEFTRTQLKQAIEEAYVNMTAAFEKFYAVEDQVTAFGESFRAAEIRFNLGVINSVEYLIVKNNLNRARINLTIARYEYLLRVKVLDFYQGIL